MCRIHLTEGNCRGANLVYERLYPTKSTECIDLKNTGLIYRKQFKRLNLRRRL
jgi:hypothetical protein